MTIDFENEYGEIQDIEDLYAAARTVISYTLDYMNCPYEACVGLTVTNNDAIQQLNRQHRGIDRATDVLSFPMSQFEKPGDFSGLEDQQDCFDPDSGELLLGDIVISGDKVLEQAGEYGHSPVREYSFLITHSMLHLMGYDHMEPEDSAEMERLQEDILEKLGICR